jgi:lipase ATG15
MILTISLELLILLVSFVQGNGFIQKPLIDFSLGHRVLEFQAAQTHKATSDGVVSFQQLAPSASTRTHPIRARPTIVSRPKSQSGFQAARWGKRDDEDELEWEQVEILGPDISDTHTLSQLARMTGDAYAKPGQKNWWDLDEHWDNSTIPVGWDAEDDGFRGHVFTSTDNSTVVLSIKGTTIISGPTMKKDKLNDNLLFSCCCARVDSSWVFNQVCNCYCGRSRCDNGCLGEALTEDSLFYSVGVVSSIIFDGQLFLNCSPESLQQHDSNVP